MQQILSSRRLTQTGNIGRIEFEKMTIPRKIKTSELLVSPILLLQSTKPPQPSVLPAITRDHFALWALGERRENLAQGDPAMVRPKTLEGLDAANPGKACQNQNWLDCAMSTPRSGKRRIRFTVINRPIAQKNTIAIRLGSLVAATSRDHAGVAFLERISRKLDIGNLPFRENLP
jgi:hypothetical protein